MQRKPKIQTSIPIASNLILRCRTKPRSSVGFVPSFSFVIFCHLVTLDSNNNNNSTNNNTDNNDHDSNNDDDAYSNSWGGWQQPKFMKAADFDFGGVEFSNLNCCPANSHAHQLLCPCWFFAKELLFGNDIHSEIWGPKKSRYFSIGIHRSFSSLTWANVSSLDLFQMNVREPGQLYAS